MKKLLVAALVAATLTSCEKENKKETKYHVNEATSKVGWKGSASDHFHVGHFGLKGSVITNANGVIKNGDFLIPIASIENYDLPAEVKPELLNHLKSADFFNMVLHPNAEFRIQQAKAYTGGDSTAVAGSNYVITGNFTMLGQTRQISFPAKVTVEGDSLKTVADLSIDRTKWGMNSYSDPSSPSYILPGVELHLDIRTAKLK